MSEMLEEFVSPIGPTTATTGGIANVAVSAATSVATDLTGASYTTLKTAIDAGRMLTIVATGDIWYRWDTATGTVDETKTAASTPANQGILLPAGAERSERPPPGTTWLITKGVPSACTLCIFVSSRSINSDIRPS